METNLEQIAVKAVNQLPKSVVREIRTPRSVGAGGGRPPPATRWARRNPRPYRDQQVGEHIKRKLDVFERYWSASLTRHVACAPDCQRFSDLPVQGIVRLNTISQERR